MCYLVMLLLSSFLIVFVCSEKIYFPEDIEDPDKFIEARKRYEAPETAAQTQTNTNISEEENEIPLDVIQKLNSIQNVSQLFDEFLIESYPTGDSKGGIYGMASRMRTSPFLSGASGDVEGKIGATLVEPLGSRNFADARSAGVQIAPVATCEKPELMTVPLTSDKNILSYPSCIRVERCGGCCRSDLLACQPTKSETLNYQVLRMKYAGGGKFERIGQEIVPIEKHVSCKCQCIIKKEDCSALQVYNEGNCKCECTNTDEMSKCLKERELKVWDHKTCACKCRNSEECAPQEFFNDITCKCDEVLTSSKGGSREGVFDYNVYRILPNYNLHKGRHQI